MSKESFFFQAAPSLRPRVENNLVVHFYRNPQEFNRDIVLSLTEDQLRPIVAIIRSCCNVVYQLYLDEEVKARFSNEFWGYIEQVYLSHLHSMAPRVSRDNT